MRFPFISSCLHQLPLPQRLLGADVCARVCTSGSGSDCSTYCTWKGKRPPATTAQRCPWEGIKLSRWHRDRSSVVTERAPAPLGEKEKQLQGGKVGIRHHHERAQRQLWSDASELSPRSTRALGPALGFAGTDAWLLLLVYGPILHHQWVFPTSSLSPCSQMSGSHLGGHIPS